MARLLTSHERVVARHWLQELSEHALAARNALDPAHGRLAVTDEVWIGQWAALRRPLDTFTENVRLGRETSGMWPGGDRNR